MEQKIHAKTFIHALSILHQDRKVLYKFINDKRLTLTERKILKCWGLLRESQHKETIEILTSLPTISDQIVESQKLIILGITYLNKGEPKLAEKYLIEARFLLEKFPVLRRQHFIVNLNLFLTFHIQKNKLGMEEALEKLNDLPQQDETEKINVKRCQFILTKFLGDYQKAQTFYNYLQNLKPQMGANLLLSFVIDEFDYFIKLEEDHKAYVALEEFKKLRSFNHGAYYQYRLVLLNHIAEDSPIYFRDDQIREIPIVYNQLKVIKFLEEKNFAEARIFWNQLSVLNPAIYLDQFKYNGDKCLFSRALDKHSTSQESPVYNISEQKDKALVQLLKNADFPLSKNYLFQCLWGNEPQNKEELNKLSQLITRAKNKFNVGIKYKKGCYYLEKNKKIS